METDATEEALRREAIRRHLLGERRCDICHNLNRTTRWFDKWRAEYSRDPQTDRGDRSRAPPTSPQALPSSVVQAVVAIRRTFEATKTPETK